jgi:hypothetical protein
MIQLHVRLDYMETTQRSEPEDGDVNEDESEYVEEEEVVEEQAIDERLLRAFVKLGTREKMEVPMYEVNMNVEEMID